MGFSHIGAQRYDALVVLSCLLEVASKLGLARFLIEIRQSIRGLSPQSRTVASRSIQTESPHPKHEERFSFNADIE